MTDVLSVKDLLPVLFERSAATETLWNLYIAVAGGLIVAVSTAPNAFRPIPVRAIVSVGFVLFALSNLDAALWIRDQRQVLADAVREAIGHDDSNQLKGLLLPQSGFNPLGANRIDPPSFKVLMCFQATIGALVMGFIWRLPSRLSQLVSADRSRDF